MSRRHDPDAVLAEVARVLRTESPRATQADLAVRLGRRYGDGTRRLALAHGSARAGVLAFDLADLRWSLADEGTAR